jgi:hypothetical protein
MGAVLPLMSVVVAVPADNPPDWVPLGVYLAWERTYTCGVWNKTDRWQDLAKRLDAAAANAVDTIWVVNLGDEDLPRLITECERRNLKLVAGMSSVEAKIADRWADNSPYYDSIIPKLVKLAGHSKTLIGWVLSDEPDEKILGRVEHLRLKFRQADPDRFCLVVSMWPQTPAVPKQTKLPVVCVDLYPFMGPNDPNGPSTAGASQGFYRGKAEEMITAIGDRKIAPWIMGQCFTEIWGPHTYDEHGHQIALPGSYLHWRCPTAAEMRWQVWEMLRVGGKGMFIFLLNPEEPNPAAAKLPPPEVPWKNVLVKTATDAGPSALTRPDGTPHPQLVELGSVYKLIAPHKPLIQRWKRVDTKFMEAKAPGQVQGFVDPATGARYAVVVNDDLQGPQSMQLNVGAGITKVIDIIKGTPIPLGDLGKIRLSLPAGSGTILEITRPPNGRQ